MKAVKKLFAWRGFYIYLMITKKSQSYETRNEERENHFQMSPSQVCSRLALTKVFWFPVLTFVWTWHLICVLVYQLQSDKLSSLCSSLLISSVDAVQHGITDWWLLVWKQSQSFVLVKRQKWNCCFSLRVINCFSSRLAAFFETTALEKTKQKNTSSISKNKEISLSNLLINSNHITVMSNIKIVVWRYEIWKQPYWVVVVHA